MTLINCFPFDQARRSFPNLPVICCSLAHSFRSVFFSHSCYGDEFMMINFCPHFIFSQTTTEIGPLRRTTVPWLPASVCWAFPEHPGAPLALAIATGSAGGSSGITLAPPLKEIKWAPQRKDPTLPSISLVDWVWEGENRAPPE